MPKGSMSPSEPQLEPQSLTKHFNEALILSALSRGPLHGYQLALDIEERSQGRFVFKHGTLYPILHKLEKEGLIEGSWSDEGQRGRRKRYQLTKRGREYLRLLRDSWHSLLANFSNLIGEDDS
jgi:DNA-binding PadR family transcriptional regulator